MRPIQGGAGRGRPGGQCGHSLALRSPQVAEAGASSRGRTGTARPSSRPWPAEPAAKTGSEASATRAGRCSASFRCVCLCPHGGPGARPAACGQTEASFRAYGDCQECPRQHRRFPLRRGTFPRADLPLRLPVVRGEGFSMPFADSALHVGQEIMAVESWPPEGTRRTCRR